MSNRKLQVEIDRTLKKVTEGLEIFHETLEKLNNAQTINQKEKFEIDLKKEIKKLQRLRDQIKNWQLQSEIKDKTPLNETRRLIELEMEKFKVLEKEIKIKAYSKEGLTKESKLDPKERERQEMIHWINNCVIQLNTQKDVFEAEIETINSQRGKDKQSRLYKSEGKLEKHNYHIRKLEMALRMLENEQISPEKIQNIKDDVDYYIEGNKNEDFVENEEIYEDLNLPDSQDDLSDYEEREKGNDNEEQENDWNNTRNNSNNNVSITSEQQHFHPPSSSEEIKLIQRKHSTPSSSVQIPFSDKLSSGILPLSQTSSSFSTSSNNTFSKVHHHTFAQVQPSHSQVVGTSMNNNINTSSVSKISTPTKPIIIQHTSSSMNKTMNSNNPTIISSGTPSSSPSTIPTMITAANANPSINPISNTFSTSGMGANSASVGGGTSRHSANAKGPSFASAASANLNFNASTGITTSATTIAAMATPSFSMAGVSNAMGQSQSSSISISQTNSNDMDPNIKVYFNISDPNMDSMFSELRSRAQSLRQSRLKDISNVISNSVQYCSDAYEVEKSRQFIPKQPYQSSSYYPTIIPSILENPSIFERFELDTLFFIFYYQQHTYAQYLAARELKRQSWRFHKKYLTWFQRHEEPKSINDEYEQGTYIYFDYEGSWCQRKKTEFTFEYRYLEDEDTV